ncbi:MAG TPA: hypothetical protein VFG23_00080 [Polyangia bacterium]|nr:hypothetical protein [Polyangia bacterium]
MSSTFRKTLICLVAVFALSAVTASASFALTKYEFLKGGAGLSPKEFTGKQGGNSVLRATGLEVICTEGSSTGKFATNTSKVEKVIVKFHGCTSNAGKCEVHSKNVPVNGDRDGDSDEIVTSQINGTLGATTTGTSKVGLDLEPTGSTTFTELEFVGKECPSLAKIKGSVIGEISPVNSGAIGTGQVVKHTLKFEENATKEQLIQNIEEEGKGGTADNGDVLTGFAGNNRLTNTTEIELTSKEAFEVHT